jgi:hypothetical protein
MNKIFKGKTRGDHFRFGSVFIQKIQPNWKKKETRNRPKPADFGLVFYPKNQKNLYAFFWTFLALLAQCHHEKTETSPF